MTRPTFQQKRIDRQYRELRALSPDLFSKCVRYAEAIGIKHKAFLSLSDADRLAVLADIKQTLVDMALTAHAEASR